MQQIKERLAYLRGLAEGLNVGAGSPEGRVLVGILDVLGDMSSAYERMNGSIGQIEEYIEAVDDDLTDLENEFYDFDDDEYDEDLELAYDMDEDELDELAFPIEDDDDTAIEYLEMTCPNCHETVFVDEDVFTNDEIIEVLCPECKETILVNDDSPAVTGSALLDDEI
ncbi:MAG TPA: hypothetical protein VFV52_17740 [Bacilli bacterium]|nr:hypothetical protein [Bacilli bacterium]